MEQSILTSTKKVLGVDALYTIFDEDIMMHINATFAILSQLGCGPTAGFSIDDESAVWANFVDPGPTQHLTKTYLFLNVKTLFDPPTTSYMLTAVGTQIKEYEWRLHTLSETV
jgi:hypothetical protein